MNFLSDLHTHSIVSGHGYSTLLENINYCKENGIKILGTSEHGPKMPGSPHRWYFHNIQNIPRIINNIIILRGCEASILDIKGNIDLEPFVIPRLDYLILSFHEAVFSPNTLENNTKALINAINKHDNIEILGHLGNPNYPIDYELIIKLAIEKNILIEINNCSIKGVSRNGSSDNCKYIATLCKKYGAKIILTSDAHICFDIGNYEYSENILKEINFPDELIMNYPKKLINHFHQKGKLLDVDYTNI